MMTFMPSICFAAEKADSAILHNLWSHAQRNPSSIEGVEQNVYTCFHFKTVRRNATLLLIPTMYSIAKGEREYFGETYNRLTFHTISNYDVNEQVVCGTIPSYRNVMPMLKLFLTPDLYNVSLFPNQLLSPFNRSNRHFYTYRIFFRDSPQCILEFRPRLSNTQLVKGYAVVNPMTGYIHSTMFEGNFDMVDFKVTAVMPPEEKNLIIPSRCTTDATFKFAGNNIKASFSAHYDLPTTLSDSIHDSHDIELMETLRPKELPQEEQDIYAHHQEKMKADADSVSPRKKNRFRDFMWNVVGDNLVNSIHTGNGATTLRISPLLNPLYFGYSQSKGISYKINIGGQYKWNSHRYLTLNPQLGYNFKIKQFFYTAPLRMTYNPKRNGYAELTWANGNRISNDALTEDIQEKMGEDFEVPEYKDESLQLVNNVQAYDWLEILAGLVYHRRSSTNHQTMIDVGMQPVYSSFAPLLTLRFNLWTDGPTLTANYEHSFPNIMSSDLKYDLWEFDLSYKRQMQSLRAINFRVGTGFYTSRNTDYFVDFNNFRDNNLPSSWTDDWTGQFQLLDSKWYNESNYYVRGHVSYESPLLALTWLPWIGRLLETERLYFSALNIEHTRPYFEIGYGFTNRYFSTGLFVSTLNTKFKEFGCRVTIELFRKW